MRKLLFLDDERFPRRTALNGLVDFDIEMYQDESKWDIVRDYNEFVKWITENGLPDYVSFDHDLADIQYDGKGKMSFSYKEHTGMDCAKWLVEYCADNELKLPKYQVHSANPVGRENIEAYLRNASKHLGI